MSDAMTRTVSISAQFRDALELNLPLRIEIGGSPAMVKIFRVGAHEREWHAGHGGQDGNGSVMEPAAS